MTPALFCEINGACDDGREWASSTGCATMEELWARDDIRPEWRVWIATREGVMTDADARRFACWCVRQIWPLLTDERSRRAVEVAERHAEGLATDDELRVAREAAGTAAGTAAWAAAGTAAWAAALRGAWEAAGAAALRAATRAAQSTHLRTMTVRFEEKP